MHYEKYDAYFSVESLSESVTSLSEKGFKLFDTRSEIRHDLSKLKKLEGNFSKLKDIELKKMKDKGTIPSYHSMFGDEEINLLREIYSDDIDLYKNLFGERNLLFK